MARVIYGSFSDLTWLRYIYDVLKIGVLVSHIMMNFGISLSIKKAFNAQRKSVRKLKQLHQHTLFAALKVK